MNTTYYRLDCSVVSPKTKRTKEYVQRWPPFCANTEQELKSQVKDWKKMMKSDKRNLEIRIEGVYKITTETLDKKCFE
jgi:hypothetical protein